MFPPNYFFFLSRQTCKCRLFMFDRVSLDGEKQNHWVSKIEYIKTIFIPFMTATLDKKSVHLDSYLSENACIGYDFDVRHVAKFTVAGGQTSAEQRNRCTRVQPFRRPWKKRGKSGNSQSKCRRILGLYLGPRRHFCRKWLMRLYV